MNQKLLDILDTSKHKHKFPPRDRVTQLKMGFAARGTSQSSIEAVAITGAYIESASSVLEDFTELALRNLSSVGLTSEIEISNLFDEVFIAVTDEVRAGDRPPVVVPG